MHPSVELQLHGCHLKSCVKATVSFTATAVPISHQCLKNSLHSSGIFCTSSKKKKKQQNLIASRTFSDIHRYIFFFSFPLLFLFLSDDIQMYEKQGDTAIS